MKLKKKQYLYAISIWCADNEGRQGQRCILITRPTKINSIAAFNSVTEYIIEHNNLRSMAICNIMLLGKERV
jgi:hypothetical protein